MMGGSGFSWDGAAGPDDLGLAWDAAERHAVVLLREALPEARSAPPPIEELGTQTARFRSAFRKLPQRQLARAAWGRRPPPDDTDLWLDAAGVLATTRRHIGVDSPVFGPVTLLRPADWVGAAIGAVRSGVNAVVTSEDLVRYARRYPEIADADESSDGVYDPFAGCVADDALRRGFETALSFWTAIGAVNEQHWLTRLGWWGLPRALARAWNGNFDLAAEPDHSERDEKEASWPGQPPSLAELGIREPPLGG